MSSVTHIMSLASTLSLNDMLVLNAELAQQLLLRQAAEVEAARLAAEAEAKAEAEAEAAAGQGRKQKQKQTQYVITANGKAEGLIRHAYKTKKFENDKHEHEAIHVLTVLRNAGRGMSRADILEALDHKNLTALSKQSAKTLVDYWVKEFVKWEWIEEAE
jgi:hypothetical protein